MKLIVFKDSAGGWRWHVRGANNKLIAACGEAYTKRAHTLRMARKLFPKLKPIMA